MIHIQSTIEVRPEEAATFSATMAEIVTIQQSQGWKLVAAFVHLTGTLHTYVNLWECSDAGHYQNALVGLRTHPHFDKIRAALAKAVIRETIVLGAPVRYQ